MAVWALLLGACAPAAAGPNGTLRRYADAAMRADGAAVQALISEGTRQRTAQSGGLEVVADELKAEGESLQAALDGGMRPGIEVLVGLGEGRAVELRIEDGRWRIVSGLP